MTRELSGLQNTVSGVAEGIVAPSSQPSCLRQWPVQMRLVPANAAFLARAALLIAADCTAYACASFHQQFMSGRITLVACPKLDPVDYAEKLVPIFENNAITSLVVVKMSVPCCQEIANAAIRAIQKSGKKIPLEVVTITPEGRVLASSVKAK